MHPGLMILFGWLGSSVLLLLLYLWQRRSGDAGVADVGWSFCMGALAIFYALAGDGLPARRILMAALGAAWAFRLCGYIYFNRVHGKHEEDGRYQRLRAHWGDRAQSGFFVFFQMQAVGAVLFSLPFWAVARNAAPSLTLWDALAVVIWLVAVGGETLADAQLAAHRARPENKGKTCRSGLWRYSRHPNYFFEFVHWFAYIPLAVGTGWIWLTLAGPVVMLIFLFKFTGIPYTEMQALASRGDDYRSYQRTTSAFFPWPPRRESH